MALAAAIAGAPLPTGAAVTTATIVGLFREPHLRRTLAPVTSQQQQDYSAPDRGGVDVSMRAGSSV